MNGKTNAVFTARTTQGTTVAFNAPEARDHAVNLGRATATGESAVPAGLLEVAKAGFNDKVLTLPERPLLEALLG